MNQCAKKRNKKMETLIQTVRIFCGDIGKEFGIEKCVMLIMKSGKRQMIERTEIPNQEKVWTLGQKETFKYLGIWEVDTTNQAEMKEIV